MQENQSKDKISTQQPDPERKQKIDAMLQRMTKDRVKIFVSTVLISIVFIAIFGGIGYMLDAHYGTKPLFLFIGLGLSYVLNQLFLMKFSKKIIGR